MNPDQPHRKTIKHYHKPGDFHEFTFSCYQRRPLLTNDDWRRRLSRHLDEANQEDGMRLVAFVFMPEHLHLLVLPTTPEPDLGRYLARIKQPFSKEIKGVLESSGSSLLDRLTIQERPGKTVFRYWQEGPGFDRNFDTDEGVQNAIDYFHGNPVKRGLCRRAVEYKWSSARYYLLQPPCQQFDGLPFVHGLKE